MWLTSSCESQDTPKLTDSLGVECTQRFSAAKSLLKISKVSNHK